MFKKLLLTIFLCITPIIGFAQSRDTAPNSEYWHGAYWYGTFNNTTQLEVVIYAGVFSCWYTDQFGNPVTIQPHGGASIFSQINASWPDCYYADHYFQFFYVTVQGFNTVTGVLRAEPQSGGDHMCFTTINGISSSGFPCHPSGPLASQVWYTVTISASDGILGATGAVTGVNSG